MGAARERAPDSASIHVLLGIFERPPYLPGLLASNELSDIASAVIDELERNTLAAKVTQQRQKAQIIEVASELGLNPRPASHNDSAWIADCPRRSHTLMLSPSVNQFGCGYCRCKGDAAELGAFVGLFAVGTHEED
jgi:hypothetical protein